jgi:hypothetical protein
MPEPGRLFRLCPALALLFAGCALNAVRPPTPATRLNVDPNQPTPPCERYYALVWASQRVVRTPRYSHTFATVVHTAGRPSGEVKVLDVNTISWLPATLDIRVLARHPEPGVNLTLGETLEYARRNGERVSLWGPFELRASSYQRFVVQKHFLETSGIGYQCDDNVGEAARVGDGCDCIHAITDADPQFGRGSYPCSGSATRRVSTSPTCCASEARSSTPTSNTTRSWGCSACASARSGGVISTTGASTSRACSRRNGCSVGCSDGRRDRPPLPVRAGWAARRGFSSSEGEAASDTTSPCRGASWSCERSTRKNSRDVSHHGIAISDNARTILEKYS